MPGIISGSASFRSGLRQQEWQLSMAGERAERGFSLAQDPGVYSALQAPHPVSTPTAMGSGDPSTAVEGGKVSELLGGLVTGDQDSSNPGGCKGPQAGRWL